MELFLPEHPELLYGAAAVEPREDGLELRRMTTELSEFYSGSEAARIRAHAPAGVRIRFSTDSDYLAMAVAYGGEARPLYAVDVTVDGLELQSFTPGSRQESFCFNCELPAGTHEIEIAPPNLVECLLLGIELGEGASVTPLPARPKLLFLGDSITQGMTVSRPSLAWPSQYAAGRGCDFTNLAVGGATMRAELGKFALSYEWEEAFIAYGINDFNQGRSVAEFLDDARGMLRHLTTRAGANIHLLTPIPFPDPERNVNANGDTLRKFREGLRDLAEREFPRVRLIDGETLVPDSPDFYADNLHPNDRGATVFAEKMLAIPD